MARICLDFWYAMINRQMTLPPPICLLIHQDLSMQGDMVWNSICRPQCPQNHGDAPVFVSWMLKLSCLPLHLTRRYGIGIVNLKDMG